MQGNGKNDIRLAELSQETRLGGERAQSGNTRQMAAEFQRTDQVGERRLIQKQGPGKIKGIVPAKTIAAPMIDTGSKRDTAAMAAGGTDKNEISEAVRAEKRRPGRLQPSLATQTQRRKQQVFDSRKARGHLLYRNTYILLIIALPKAEQESSVAPSIKRARS